MNELLRLSDALNIDIHKNANEDGNMKIELSMHINVEFKKVGIMILADINISLKIKIMNLHTTELKFASKFPP